MKIGFIGLGQMGLPMARNLLRAGHEVAVYNRTRSRAESLAAADARVAGSPGEAASGAEIVVTILSDDHALEEVVFGAEGLVSGLPAGAIHVGSTTASLAMARRLAEAHRERGQRYVSAPVLGRPQAAEEAKLFIMAAGPSEVLEACRPLFSAVSQRVFVMGAEPEAANVVKLGVNFLISTVFESVGEAMALMRKHRIDPAQFLELLTSTLFGAPIYRIYGELIVREQYEPAPFPLPLGLKDLRLALAAGESAGVPMPVASVIRDHMVEAMSRGMASQDWSVVARIVAEHAGLGTAGK